MNDPKISLKMPFIMLEDGAVMVHDYESGEYIDDYEGVAFAINSPMKKGPTHSFFLLRFENGERNMTHLGNDEREAMIALAKIAIDNL